MEQTVTKSWGKRRHSAWKYFEYDDRLDLSKCVVPGGCQRPNPYVKGSGQKLMNHLERHHKTEFLEISAIEKAKSQSGTIPQQDNFVSHSGF